MLGWWWAFDWVCCGRFGYDGWMDGSGREDGGEGR